jgi:glycosyltransferase involved in cell wall biosynthesis
LNILLITDGIHPFVIGGMQKHSYYLAKYLTIQGANLTLIHCLSSNDKLPNNEVVFENIFGYLPIEKKQELKQRFHSIVLPFPAPGKLPGHYLRASYKYAEQVYEKIGHRLHEFDFIYAKGFSAWKILHLKSKGKKFPPIGVKFHGLNMFQVAANLKAKLQHFMFRPYVLFNLKQADYVFSYGGKITDIHQHIGIDRNKILEFPTGIEPSWFNENLTVNTPIKFLFVGRYERLKGVEELNETIQFLLAKKLDFEFTFVGPIPESKRITSSQVHYLGTITDVDKMKSVYQSHDVLVCPSYSEGMPNVIMEAMAQSLCVLATDVGATNILVNEQTGWLIDKPNIQTLQKTFIQIIQSPKEDIIFKKKQAFEKMNKEFLWEDISKSLYNKIEQLISIG